MSVLWINSGQDYNYSRVAYNLMSVINGHRVNEIVTGLFMPSTEHAKPIVHFLLQETKPT